MKDPHGPRSFQTTHWSLVRQAFDLGNTGQSQALEELCTAYWYPLYAFIRRQGHAPQDAEDLTQGFFATLLAQETLASANPDKGKLRSFLLTCLRRYLSDQRDRRFAQKRGADVTFSLDMDWAEKRYASDTASEELAPDRLFQRRWAITLLEFSLAAIAEEFSNKGKADLFQAVRPFLGFSEEASDSYETVAGQLDMPVGTFKSHVSRMRQRWRELLFEQVAMTLEDPSSDNIKEELSELREWI